MDEPAPGQDPISAWLEDCRKPFPGAVDLAAYVGKQARERRFLGWSRDALLRLAAISGNQDAIIKVQLDLIDKLSAALRQVNESLSEASIALSAWQNAARDSAATASLAIGRLQEQESVVLAALEWAKATESGDKVEGMAKTLDAARSYREVVGRRS